VTLDERFAGIPAPPLENGALNAELLPGSTVHRIAKDYEGRPCFVVSAKPDGRPPAPVDLQNLFFRPSIRCRIQEAGGPSTEGVFTLIAYTGKEAPVQSLFLRVMSDLLEGIGDECLCSEVSRRFDALVSLFSALTKPQRKAVQGLWAEMLIVSMASDPIALVRAWHSEPSDRYDFNYGHERLEVKSAYGSVRKHHFSLLQLTPPAGTVAVLASILIQRSGAGTTVQALWDRIRCLVSSDRDAVQHVDQVVADSLGAGLVAALDVAFDEEAASESLAFVRIADVPRIAAALHFAISEVHFAVDLSSTPLEFVPPPGAEGGLLAGARPANR
jgi:hypothetical protein